ncbi:hypothetical protein NY78_4121 [Desulfovibrio sp. TomC]|nr:hypothetical protein NY78_4121 [Desulfovibrio sp. TomC]
MRHSALLLLLLAALFLSTLFLPALHLPALHLAALLVLSHLPSILTGSHCRPGQPDGAGQQRAQSQGTEP